MSRRRAIPTAATDIETVAGLTRALAWFDTHYPLSHCPREPDWCTSCRKKCVYILLGADDGSDRNCKMPGLIAEGERLCEQCVSRRITKWNQSQLKGGL